MLFCSVQSSPVRSFSPSEAVLLILFTVSFFSSNPLRISLWSAYLFRLSALTRIIQRQIRLVETHKPYSTTYHLDATTTTTPHPTQPSPTYPADPSCSPHLPQPPQCLAPLVNSLPDPAASVAGRDRADKSLSLSLPMMDLEYIANRLYYSTGEELYNTHIKGVKYPPNKT